MANQQTKLQTINWSKKLSARVQSIKPSGIREFFDVVAERDDCISLGVGEPDFVSPQVVLDEAIQSIRKGYTHYTGNQGLPELRKEVANYLKDKYNLDYNPADEILITVGVSQGIDLAFRSILNENDQVLFPSPSYVSYAPMTILAGAEALPVTTDFESGFKLNHSELEKSITKQAKALLLNYPSNPTGSSFNRDQLDRIAKVISDNDLLVVSDEIYAELSYENDHIAFASLEGMRNRTVMLGGFSKGFAMTGWRVGYACGPKEWIQSMLKIHQYSMLCVPTVSQFAAIAALKYAQTECDRMKESYRIRRDLIVDGFNQMGLSCHKPEGAFYVFPSIHGLGLSSLEFAKRLIAEADVAVVPGTAFGKEGEGFIRCSYATNLEEIKKALEKIANFVNKVRV